MKDPPKKLNSLNYLRGDKKIKKLTKEETFIKREEEE